NPDADARGGEPLFTRYPVGEEYYSNRVNCLYEDRAGLLWAGTDDGLYRLEETKGRMAFHRIEMGKPSSVVPKSSINSFVEGRDGSLWITVGAGTAPRLADGH